MIHRLDFEQGVAGYKCPTCGTADRNLYAICHHPMCPDGRDQSGGTYYSSDPPSYKGFLVFMTLILLLCVVMITMHFLSGYYCRARWEAGSLYQARYTHSTGCLVSPKGHDYWVPERAVK